MNEEIINLDACGQNISIEIGGSASSVISVNGRYGYVVLNKNDVGLSEVDNTRDINKPLSYATINALMSSGNWDQVYNYVKSTSSTWINQKVIDYTHRHFLPLSGNSTVFGNITAAKDFYTFGSIISAGRPLVDLLASFGYDELSRTLLKNGSANWDKTYSTVNSNSASWQKAADELNKYLPLSGGDVTGNVSVSALILDQVIYTDEFIVNPDIDLIREWFYVDQFVKVIVDENTPRFIRLYQLNYLEPWTNEDGDIFVTTQNGDVLMF